MNWTLIFTVIALFICVTYNAALINIFGVPKSLSMSYYLFKEKQEKLKILFPVMIFSIVGLLMPAWLEISEGSNFQFLSFLAAGSIAFVGATPTFKSSSLENTVHDISAYFAALCAILWVCLVAKMWYIIVIWLLIVTLQALISKSVRTSYIYWLETIAFLSTFTSIIVYCLI